MKFHLRRIKTKYLIVVIMAFILLFLSYKSIVTALTKNFTQSSWAGGADTNATVEESTAAGWTKYYSGTSGIDTTTSTSVKLKLETTAP